VTMFLLRFSAAVERPEFPWRIATNPSKSVHIRPLIPNPSKSVHYSPGGEKRCGVPKSALALPSTRKKKKIPRTANPVQRSRPCM
jgi:hypothetical protein